MPVKQFTRNGKTFEALQVEDTREGRQALTDFAGAAVSVTATRIFITSINEGGQHNGNVEIHAGDWVVKDPSTGRFHATNDKVFKTSYKAA